MTYPAGIYVAEDGRAHVPIAGTGGASAPTTGDWRVGDIAQDTAGALWTCTVAGTPGTWEAVTTAHRFAATSGNPIATVVSTSSATELVSVATPALLAGDELQFRFVGDHLNTTGSNRTFVVAFVLGGTQMFTITTAAQGSGAARGKWLLHVNVKVEAIGGSPVLITSGFLTVVATNNATNWATPGVFSGMVRSTAVDLTAASTAVINITPSFSDATCDWRLIDYTADRVRP